MIKPASFLQIVIGFSAVLYLLVLTGCGHPRYEFKPDEAYTHLSLLYGREIDMEKDGNMYTLKPEEDSYIKIPVNERINLGIFIYFNQNFGTYSISYSAYPCLSFIPRENQHYIVDANLVEKKAFIELVKKDTDSETGIAIDYTVRAPVYFPKKKK